MEKLLKKVFVVILIIILVLSAGCSGSNTQSSTPPTPASQVKTDNGPVALSFMHFYKSEVTDSTGYAFHQQIARFKADHPNVTINEEELSVDTYEIKIKTVAAANELPDLFIIKGSMINSAIENDLMGPVNDLFDADKAWCDNFLPGAFDEFIRNGKIYAIPFDMTSTSLIYYNRDIFAECGIVEFPATWDELVNDCIKIKAKGYIPIAMGNKGKWLSESCVLSTLASRFTGNDWFLSIRDNKGAKFTDPEFVKSLDAFQQLARAGAFNSDLNNIDNDQQKTIYYNKKAAMFFEGGWAIGSVSNDCPKDVLDATELALIPAVSGGKGDSNSMSAGSGWGNNISSRLTGKKRTIAGEVLKYISNKDFARITFENNGFPAMKPSEDTDRGKISALSQKYLDLSAKVKFDPIYDCQLSPSVIEVMCSGLQELLIDKSTPEELARQIEAEYEKP